MAVVVMQEMLNGMIIVLFPGSLRAILRTLVSVGAWGVFPFKRCKVAENLRRWNSPASAGTYRKSCFTNDEEISSNYRSDKAGRSQWF